VIAIRTRVFDFPIDCDVSASPQVAVTAAAALQSNAASGVRRELYDHLDTHTPQTDDASDSSPIDAALNAYAT
jgi:hypothetical protein